MQQTNRRIRQIDDNIQFRPSTTMPKKPNNANTIDSNDENQCPNLSMVKECTAVAQMVKMFDSAGARSIVVNGENNGRGVVHDAVKNIKADNHLHYSDIIKSRQDNIMDTEKESRRKIMLQERRMEKLLKTHSVNGSGGGVPVEMSSCHDDVKETMVGENYTCGVEKEEKEIVSRHLKSSRECTSPAVTFIEQDKNVGSLSFISRTILLGLILYEIQLHCRYTALFFNSILCHVRHCLGKLGLLEFIDSSHVIQSGNILVFRALLLELRQRSSLDVDSLLHLAFVGAFAMRGIYVASVWANSCCSRHCTFQFKKLLLLVLIVCCWLVTFPLYNKCNTESGRYCIFAVTKTMVSPRYSWLDINAIKLYKSMSVILKTKIRGRLIKEARRAFVNPFRFHGRLKKLFTFIRWAKFLAPLIGTCNKLRGHILDMMKKKGQHLTSKTAHKMWSDLLEALTSQSKQERAVLQLQKCFRERIERKAKRRIELIASHRPNARHIKQHLRQQRTISKSKLIKMEKRDSERQLRRQVSEQEKVDIVRYRQLRKQDKKRLLLSPKTAFAVGWKYVAISCVILEVSQMILAPLLSGEMKKMPLDQFLLAVLFASCDNKKASSMCATSPWKHHWLMVVHVFSRFMVPFVHAICFLDVFVTFFTGELTASGKLVPKPFFVRYILPGIGLQLIVNPTMLAFSQLVKSTIVHSVQVGPSICFHLMLICLPLVHWIYDLVLDVVIDFVDRQNKILSNRSLNIF